MAPTFSASSPPTIPQPRPSPCKWRSWTSISTTRNSAPRLPLGYPLDGRRPRCRRAVLDRAQRPRDRRCRGRSMQHWFGAVLRGDNERSSSARARTFRNRARYTPTWVGRSDRRRCTIGTLLHGCAIGEVIADRHGRVVPTTRRRMPRDAGGTGKDLRRFCLIAAARQGDSTEMPIEGFFAGVRIRVPLGRTIAVGRRRSCDRLSTGTRPTGCDSMRRTIWPARRPERSGRVSASRASSARIMVWR